MFLAVYPVHAGVVGSGMEYRIVLKPAGFGGCGAACCTSPYQSAEDRLCALPPFARDDRSGHHHRCDGSDHLRPGLVDIPRPWV